jgi:predicted DNA-binding transcriptional regulator AlpA
MVAATEPNPSLLTPTDILTPAELATRLKVKPGWIYEQMRPTRKNPLPHMRAGRFLRFSWTAICQWMQGATFTEKKPSRSARLKRS